MSQHIIEVKHVKKEFIKKRKKTVILRDVSFNVKKWDIFGFLWANWVGKTTLLKCIFHFHGTTSWTIKLFGETDYYKQEIFQKIWYAPEQTFLYPFLTADELLEYMGKLAGVSKANIKKRADELIHTLWLDFARDRRISAYSKGMKQRLSLAASLINDPDLIFWDEPMSWLDPLGRILVKNLMRDLKKKWKTLFFNTHILSDVQEVADEFAILHNGEIVYEDKPSHIEWSLEEFFTKTVREIDKHVKVQ